MANRWLSENPMPYFMADTVLMLTDGSLLLDSVAGLGWYRIEPDARGHFWAAAATLVGAFPMTPQRRCRAWGALRGGRFFGYDTLDGGTALAPAPQIGIELEDDLVFGTIAGAPQRLAMKMHNVGREDLRIDSIVRVAGSTRFEITPHPVTPWIIIPGDQREVSVCFESGVCGRSEQALIRIISNDPLKPFFEVAAQAGGLSVEVSSLRNEGGLPPPHPTKQ